VVDRNLRDSRRYGDVKVGKRQPQASAWTPASEVRHLGHRLDHRLNSWLVFRQFEPEGEQIFSRCVGNFIDEGLSRKLL
jgi:hypothetical protein